MNNSIDDMLGPIVGCLIVGGILLCLIFTVTSCEVGEKKDAILAIASKWGLSKAEWKSIGAHS